VSDCDDFMDRGQLYTVDTTYLPERCQPVMLLHSPAQQLSEAMGFYTGDASYGDGYEV